MRGDEGEATRQYLAARLGRQKFIFVEEFARAQRPAGDPMRSFLGLAFTAFLSAVLALGANADPVGHWENDTLAIETVGFRDDLWLDMREDPLTNSAKMTERIRRPNFGTLEIQLTVDDPKAYTKPWTVTLQQVIKLDTELVDEICLENEQSVRHMNGK